jgi:hypothetical protein
MGGTMYVVVADTKDMRAALVYSFKFAPDQGADKQLAIELRCDSKTTPKDFKVYFDGPTESVSIGPAVKGTDGLVHYSAMFSGDVLHDMYCLEDFTIRIRYFVGDELKSFTVDKQNIATGISVIWNLFNFDK